MFPDYLVIRVVLNLIIIPLSSLPLLSFLYLSLSQLTSPAPPLILLPSEVVSLRFLKDNAMIFEGFKIWFILELSWRVLNGVLRGLIERGWWELTPSDDDEMDAKAETEERWAVYKSTLESCHDPGEWLAGWFSISRDLDGLNAPRRERRRHARLGAKDESVLGVDISKVGRENIKEFLISAFFNQTRATQSASAADEVHSMLLLLERSISPTFNFPAGRTKHQTLLIRENPFNTQHLPVIFYLITCTVSELMNFALWCFGFKWYGHSRTLWFERGNKKMLDKLIDSRLDEDTRRVGNKLGYWFHPGSTSTSTSFQTPIIFIHGLASTYSPTPFILALQYLTRRPIFVPELPYLAMRLAGPDSIVGRKSYTAGVKVMLERHGFLIAEASEASELAGDCGGAILVSHSLGSGMIAWLIRDTPALVAGVVLIDPMSVLLFCADGPRNFFRTTCLTAGEIFFAFFAKERGISHFLNRHLIWTESVLFTSSPPFPLSPTLVSTFIPSSASLSSPPSVALVKPNYAPKISPYPLGPIPSIVFVSMNDCIIPIPKVVKFLEGSGFKEGVSLMKMELDHGGCLTQWFWIKAIAEAVNKIAVVAEN